jgi:anthranilate phosphoribosyltransferase
VFNKKGMELMAAAIRLLEPEKKVLLVHSTEGWDEATTCGDFIMYDSAGQQTIRNASEFGMQNCSVEDLSGEGPDANAAIALSILKGEKGPKRDAVLLNAAFAIQLYHPHCTIEKSLYSAMASLDSGEALNVVRKLQEKFPVKAL